MKKIKKERKKERKKGRKEERVPAVAQTRDRCFLARVYKDVERVCITEMKGVER
jgi:hypothetical protein